MVDVQLNLKEYVPWLNETEEEIYVRVAPLDANMGKEFLLCEGIRNLKPVGESCLLFTPNLQPWKAKFHVRVSMFSVRPGRGRGKSNADARRHSRIDVPKISIHRSALKFIGLTG